MHVGEARGVCEHKLYDVPYYTPPTQAVIFFVFFQENKL